MEKKRGKHEKTSVTKRSKHQHNTDDGGQATGEGMRHVQMSRWGKYIGEESKQQ